MSIEQTRTTTDRTILAGQHIDRMPAVPAIVGRFVRVVPTGATNAYGLPIYQDAPECWKYTIRVESPALMVEFQKVASRIVAADAIARFASARGISTPTAAEIDAAVSGGYAVGVTFDAALTGAWESLETRRRAGEPLAIIVDVTEGKTHLEAAGLPTR